MVTAATEILSRRGFSGTTVRAVLERSGAPRGSVGFHFPGGRSELVSAAFDEVGGQVEAALIDMEEQGRTGAELLGAMCEFYAESLRGSGFCSGCPIGSALAEIHDDTEFAPRLRTILETWVRVLARTLRRDGVSADDADELSMLAISSLEGAILTARITRDTAPVEAVRRRICPLLVP